jgi:hypothetical protein
VRQHAAPAPRPAAPSWRPPAHPLPSLSPFDRNHEDFAQNNNNKVDKNSFANLLFRKGLAGAGAGENALAISQTDKSTGEPVDFIASVFDVYGTMPHGLFLGVENPSTGRPQKWAMFMHGGVELGLDARNFLFAQRNDAKTVVIGGHKEFKNVGGKVTENVVQVVKLIDRSFISSLLPASNDVHHPSFGSKEYLFEEVKNKLRCEAYKNIRQLLSVDDILGAGHIKTWKKETNNDFTDRSAWPADDYVEWEGKPIFAHMALQLRWGDFSDKPGDFWAMRSLGRQKLGSYLTETWMRAHGVAAIFRGHQHNGNYLTGLLNGGGFFDAWGTGSVQTIISGANMFGPRRLGDAFAVLGMTGDAPATWKLTKCTRAPDLPLALPRGTAPPKPKLEKLTCLEDKGWKAGDPASRRKQSFGGESSDDEDNIIMKRKGRSNDQRKAAEDEQQIDSSSSSRCPKISMPGSDEEDFGRLFFSKESSQRIQQRRKSKGDSIPMNHIKAGADDHIMQPDGANAIQSNMIIRRDSLDKPQPQPNIIQKGPIINHQEQQRDIRGPVGTQQPPPDADALLAVVR